MLVLGAMLDLLLWVLFAAQLYVLRATQILAGLVQMDIICHQILASLAHLRALHVPMVSVNNAQQDTSSQVHHA